MINLSVVDKMRRKYNKKNHQKRRHNKRRCYTKDYKERDRNDYYSFGFFIGYY
jgi:hypothetical protein